MAGKTPVYEFESHSFEHPTTDLPRLEMLAEKLRAQCTGYAMFGMHEYLLETPNGKSILDQDHVDDREFAEAVLTSAGIDDPRSVDKIFANIITGSGAYNSYLQTNRDTPAGNFHADPRQVEADGKVLFLPPQAGRLAIALFDDGVWSIEGDVSVPASRTNHYVCVDPGLRSSQYYDGMRGHRQLIVGEDGHFLRGPADIARFADKHGAVRHGPGQWRYWDIEFIHMAGEVTKPGRVQIAIDFMPGQEPQNR